MDHDPCRSGDHCGGSDRKTACDPSGRKRDKGFSDFKIRNPQRYGTYQGRIVSKRYIPSMQEHGQKGIEIHTILFHIRIGCELLQRDFLRNTV